MVSPSAIFSIVKGLFSVGSAVLGMIPEEKSNTRVKLMAGNRVQDGEDSAGHIPNVFVYNSQFKQVGWKKGGAWLGSEDYTYRDMDDSNSNIEYLQVVHQWSDPICIAWMGLSNPNRKALIPGDIGYYCTGQWYYTDITRYDDANKKFKCFWLGANGEPNGSPRDVILKVSAFQDSVSSSVWDQGNCGGLVRKNAGDGPTYVKRDDSVFDKYFSHKLSVVENDDWVWELCSSDTSMGPDMYSKSGKILCSMKDKTIVEIGQKRSDTAESELFNRYETIDIFNMTSNDY